MKSARSENLKKKANSIKLGPSNTVNPIAIGKTAEGTN